MNATDFDDMKPVIISAVVVMNVTLNVLVIAVLARYPQLREDRSALFVLCLTLSDLAIGCTAMPISAAVCSRATPHVRHMTHFLPKIQAFCSVWFSFNSVHSLCWVTVCKMIAITKPFRYEQLLTTRRCWTIIAAIWLTGAVLSTSGIPDVGEWNMSTCSYSQPVETRVSVVLLFGLLLGVVVPLLAITYATTRIFFAILRTHHQMTAQVDSIGGQNADVIQSESLALRALRSGRNILLILLVLLVLSFPIIIYFVAMTIGKESSLPSSYSFLALWTVMCNSAANSLFYLVLFRSVRKKTALMFSEVWTLCHC